MLFRNMAWPFLDGDKLACQDFWDLSYNVSGLEKE